MKQYTILTADGFRVGVTEGGSGIPLVFLHGLSVSAGAYLEMLELLADNGFHVFAFDAPDHGGSDSLPWGHDVPDMAYKIWQAVQQIPALCGSEMVLVGHSMGGWIAAEYASRWSCFVHTLILLDAAVGEEFHGGIKLKHGAQFLASALKDVYGDVRKAGSIRGSHGRTDGATGATAAFRCLAERLSLISRLTSSVSGPGIVRAVNAMVHGDSSDALKALRGQVRTVIVHGSEDGIIPWKSGLHAATAAAGKFRLLGGKYHSWMISDPEQALDVIRGAVFGGNDLTPNEGDAA